MFLTRSEYDRGVNTFSPEGRLFQVEYAIEAIKLGSTALGIRTEQGVVLAVEKRVTSCLMEPSSLEKITQLDGHIACAFSGLTADARMLVDKARVESQNHWFAYNEPIKVESVTQSISNMALKFSEDNQEDDDEMSMSRPFGVALLVAGIDKEGPRLFHLDPSGTYIHFDAKAIGSGSEGAQTSLQEMYKKDLSIDEVTVHSLQILKQVMEDKLSSVNVEVVQVLLDGTCKRLSQDELKGYIAEMSK